MGYTATWAGYATAPMGILAVASSPVIGRLLPKVDPRWLVSYGMGMLALSFGMRALLTSQADFLSVAVPTLILGAGIPACVITLTSLGVSDLSADKIAGGSGLQNFLRVLCMAIGSSLTQTYWEHMTKFSRAELVASIDPAMSMSMSAQISQAGVGGEGATAALSRLVDAQAIMLATNDFYQSAAILMLCSIAVIWLVKPPKGPLKAVSGH
jgi:DHA2 family multidrug resistance protein